MKKTLIFVDGQNLFYSLKDMGIQEVDINWNAFLQGCLDKDDELIRAYWYQAQKLSNPNITLDKAQRIVERQNSGKSPTEINTLANDLVKKAQV